MLDVVLQPGRDRSRAPPPSLGALGRGRARARRARAGELVRVLSAEGEVLGHGDYSPHSPLRVRLLGFGKERPPDGLLRRAHRGGGGAPRGEPAARATPTRCAS